MKEEQNPTHVAQSADAQSKKALVEALLQRQLSGGGARGGACVSTCGPCGRCGECEG
jgi:hypothetical protein